MEISKVYFRGITTSKSRHSAEWKIALVKRYLSGEGSYAEIAEAHSIGETTLKNWVRKYQKQGDAGFWRGTGDRHYSQVYSWVRKYLKDGVEGLEDRRGHHKRDDEVDELERLRRENVRLKQQLSEIDVLCKLLKKRRNSKGGEPWQSQI